MGNINTQKNKEPVSPLDNEFNKLAMPNKDELVLPQANSSLPKDIEEIVIKNNYDKNLIKKDEKTGIYTYCEGDQCTILGKSKFDNDPKKVEEDRIAKELLKLNNIPANTKVEFKKEGGTGGEFTIIDNTNSMYGVCNLKKNTDGTFKLEPLAKFTGSFKINGEEISVKSGDLKSVSPTTNNAETSQAVDKDISYLSMTSNDARLYLQNNPKENIFIIVTAPKWCKPCQLYEPNINPISKALKSLATVIVVKVEEDESESVMSDFGIDKLPRTFLFSKDRPSPYQSQVVFKGPQVSENLKDKLNSLDKINSK